MRKLVVIAASLAVGCGPSATTIAQPGTAVSSSTNRELVRTGVTASGQPLRLPQGKAEMVATVVDLPPGGLTTIHQHPWSRFVYIERGSIKVTNFDRKEAKDFQAGEVFPEVIAEWHQGQAGPNGVHLIVIDLVPPGETNMVMR